MAPETTRIFRYAMLLLALAALPGTAIHGQERVFHDVEGLSAGRSDSAALMQDPAPDFQRPAWHQMVTNVPGDWSRSAGWTFRTRSVPVVAGLAAVTAAFMMTDQRLYVGSKHIAERSSFVNSSSRVLVGGGDGVTHLALAGAFGLYGLCADDTRSVRVASQTVESFLASGIVVQVLKHMTGREIPRVATQDGGAWRFFPGFKEYNSHQSRYFAYPSGHITTTMSTVTVLIENYPETWWLRPAGYTVVGLVGFSLVNSGYHWYSDLPLGIALGYAFGHIVSHPGEPASDDQTGSSTTVTWHPVLDSRMAGMGVLVSF